MARLLQGVSHGSHGGPPRAPVVWQEAFDAAGGDGLSPDTIVQVRRLARCTSYHIHLVNLHACRCRM